MASLASNGFPSERFYGYDVTDNLTRDTHLILNLKRSSLLNGMDDVYCREDERLKTFDRWPLDWLDKFQLAQTGMFYTGEDDKVKCYFCEVEIGCWVREDQPVPEHLRWSPNCPLLRRRTTNNVPISSEALDAVLPPVSYDICGANDTRMVYTEGTISAEAFNNSNMGASNVGGECNTTAGSSGATYFPEFPEYAIESARLRSFAEWPRIMKQKPHQLAEAGFFYTGSGDRVKCFSCGGGLKDWDDNDDPWEQHALWLSKCRFLKLIKGETYIDAIIAKESKAKDADAEEAAPALAAATAAAAEVQDEQMEAVSQHSNNAATGVSTAAAVETKSSTPVATGIVNGAEVAPETTATRIFDKIVACDQQSAAEGACAAQAGNVSNADVCERKATAAAATVCIPEEKLCKICYAGEYNTAFLPCGHVVACAKCASSVTKCPLCRKPFTDVMRVYFS